MTELEQIARDNALIQKDIDAGVFSGEELKEVSTLTENIDVAYNAAMVTFFDRLKALESHAIENMIAPDQFAAEEGLIDWGHVGDLNRVNELLNQVKEIITGNGFNT